MPLLEFARLYYTLSYCYCRLWIAHIAQLVEHFHGKEGVSGSIPDNGSTKF